MPVNPETPTEPDAGSDTPAPGLEPAAQKLVSRARADLAQRLGIPEEEITASSVEAVTWPDSSLGCPQPGMAYAQALVPGYLVVLEAGGKTWEYHANRSTTVFYCENPEAPIPGTPADI